VGFCPSRAACCEPEGIGAVMRAIRCIAAVLGVLAAAGPAPAVSDYALGSFHARALVATGDEHFGGAAMQWDRTVLWQDLAGQLGTIAVTQVAPTNAENARVSATGHALVSNPHVSLNQPYAWMRYWLAWSAGPLPRTGEITAGFDTAATDAPQAELSAPQLYRTQVGGHEALLVSVTSGLPRHGAVFDILPGSTMTYDLEFGGNWTLGGDGPGGARRVIFSFGGTPFTVVEDFAYDLSRDVTRLVVAQEYQYSSTFNSLRINATLIGQPVPSPATGLLVLAALVTRARHRRSKRDSFIAPL